LRAASDTVGFATLLSVIAFRGVWTAPTMTSDNGTRGLPATASRLATRIIEAGFWLVLGKSLLWLIAPRALYQISNG